MPTIHLQYMNIIQEKSILYHLPKELPLKEFLIFDAVRFSFEIIDQSFGELISELETTSKTNQRNVSRAFHFAWTIVDYTNRINDLLYQLPWQNKNEILGDFYYLKDFRDTFQHLGIRNSAVLKKHTPFFGILSWFYQDQKTSGHQLHYLLSGVGRRAKMEIKVPDTTKFNKGVNSISLHSLNKKKVIIAQLDNVIADLGKLCLDLESRIQEFYTEHSLTLADWTARRDIHVILKPEDYKEEKK